MHMLLLLVRRRVGAGVRSRSRCSITSRSRWWSDLLKRRVEISEKKEERKKDLSARVTLKCDGFVCTISNESINDCCFFSMQ
jgi:hypothetical protein